MAEFLPPGRQRGREQGNWSVTTARPPQEGRSRAGPDQGRSVRGLPGLGLGSSASSQPRTLRAGGLPSTTAQRPRPGPPPAPVGARAWLQQLPGPCLTPPRRCHPHPHGDTGPVSLLWFRKQLPHFLTQPLRNEGNPPGTPQICGSPLCAEGQAPGGGGRRRAGHRVEMGARGQGERLVSQGGDPGWLLGLPPACAQACDLSTPSPALPPQGPASRARGLGREASDSPTRAPPRASGSARLRAAHR